MVEEPGRRIIAEALAGNGAALPWVDPVAFARRAIAMALEDRAAAPADGWVFFDRGLIDAVVALEHLTGEPAIGPLASAHPHNRQVFLAPPWPEIHVIDHERRHSLSEAIDEYERLRLAYPALGYEITLLPKVGVRARADFVEAALVAS